MPRHRVAHIFLADGEALSHGSALRARCERQPIDSHSDPVAAWLQRATRALKGIIIVHQGRKVEA